MANENIETLISNLLFRNVKKPKPSFSKTDFASPSEESATEKALLKYCIDMGLEQRRSEYEKLSEIPFSSDRKFMSVQCRDIKNPEGANIHFIKGAVEEVLEKCTNILTSGRSQVLTENLTSVIYKSVSALAG